MEKVSIVYIAGYGRSGSTLLDIILGNEGAVFSAGELATVFEEAFDGYSCSCGESYQKCEIWNGYFSDVSREEINERRLVTRLVDRRASIAIPHKKQLSSRERGTYRRVWIDVISALRREGIQVIVDSSKTSANTSFRPVALKEIAGQDVKVIHIKRKIVPVLRSLLKGSNRTLQNKRATRIPFESQVGLHSSADYVATAHAGKVARVGRGIIGKFLADRDARKLKRRLGKENYFQVHYEHLVSSPLEVIERLEAYLGANFERIKQIARSGGKFGVEHIVGGNRIAQGKSIGISQS